MFLSIVIPAYNATKTIIPLLASLATSVSVQWSDIEIIIVDDVSVDNTVEKILAFLVAKKFFWCRIIVLSKHGGPARARNIGVNYAKSAVVLFLDADVVVKRKTIARVIQAFQEDPDLMALTGVWEKRQKTKDFFPRFKALRDWSYWVNERDPRNYYYLFSTRVAAINRAFFLRLGGFSQQYKTALVEDIELTYRIVKRHAIIFRPDVIVSHEFEPFWALARKYFWRSYFWTKLYRTRKKFDPVATTGKEAMTTLSAVASIVFLSISPFFYWFGVVSAVFFFLHILGVQKFLRFVAKEEGLLFAGKSLLAGFIFSWIIVAGAICSTLRVFDR